MPMNNQYQNNYMPYSPYGNYGGYYPYQQQRYEPQQQVQQMQNQFAGISGKFVPAVESITANDVPMDGSVALFPKQDMTEIYAKQWNADGTIRTMVYKPILDGQTSNLSSEDKKQGFATVEDVRTVFREEINGLYGKIEELEQSIGRSGSKTRTSTTKKESAE